MPQLPHNPQSEALQGNVTKSMVDNNALHLGSLSWLDPPQKNEH